MFERVGNIAHPFDLKPKAMIKTTYLVQSRRAIYFTECGQVEFNYRGWGYDGATFATTKDNVKKAVEALPDFKRGTIKKIEEVELGESKKPEAKVETPKENNPLENIVTINEAANYIKSIYKEQGKVAPALRSKKDVLAAAEALGISFPNIK